VYVMYYYNIEYIYKMNLNLNATSTLKQHLLGIRFGLGTVSIASNSTS